MSGDGVEINPRFGMLGFLFFEDTLNFSNNMFDGVIVVYFGLNSCIGKCPKHAKKHKLNLRTHPKEEKFAQ